MQDQPTTEEIKANVQNSNVWLRLFYMVLFAILYWAAEVVLGIVILFQFLSVLLTGKKNDNVLSFGAQLATYIYQILSFLTFNTEEKVFPFADWPAKSTPAPADDVPESTAEEPATATEAPAKRAPRKRTVKKATDTKTDNETDANEAPESKEEPKER